jgi:molybdopterin-guanine dinucleotide biosynthesis protein A
MDLTESGLTAVVLAGGPHDAVAALTPGAPNKSFVSVGGRTLVKRTISALRASRRISRVVVVAPFVPSALAELEEAHEIRRDGPTMYDSLRSGLSGRPEHELVLVVAADLPVLSAAAVDEFVDLALHSQADLVYACVEERVHAARFPGVPHTWARLRGGRYCGGGCAALRPRVLASLEGILGDLGAARKNPLRLAAIFGPSILARYALGRLSVPEAAQRASELLGAPAAAAICTYPEIAVNVDRITDVALAERLVAISSD